MVSLCDTLAISTDLSAVYLYNIYSMKCQPLTVYIVLLDELESRAPTPRACTSIIIIVVYYVYECDDPYLR